MQMQTKWLMVVTVIASGCVGKDDAFQRRTAVAPPAVEPTKIAGDYEFWICETGECGPGTQMSNSRMGRLILTAEPAIDPSVTGPAYGGCVNISDQTHYDPSARRTRIAWQAADTAGQLRFAIDRATNAEFEIQVRDEGGMLRGRGLWRRDGVLSDDHPSVVIARRLAEATAASCPAVEPVVVSPAAASPAPAKPATKP